MQPGLEKRSGGVDLPLHNRSTSEPVGVAALPS